MQNRTKMSGSTEPSQLLMSVKEEVKEEEFDDFLQEYLSASKKVEVAGLKHDCKTETKRSPTLTCKEEKSSLMDIKQEDESGLKYDLIASRPTSKLQIILYHEKQNKKI